MSVVETEDAFVVPAAGQISLGQIFSTTASSANPTYLVLTGLDRNEYTAGATRATGSLSGNGETARFGALGGDARSLGLVFTYDASTGRYYNATYGYLDQMTYTASGSLDDLTELSLFGFSDLSHASAWGSDPYALMSWDSPDYLGSVAVATQPSFSGAVPAQATPDSIASIAATFVGDAWNMDGCWVRPFRFSPRLPCWLGGQLWRTLLHVCVRLSLPCRWLVARQRLTLRCRRQHGDLVRAGRRQHRAGPCAASAQEAPGLATLAVERCHDAPPPAGLVVNRLSGLRSTIVVWAFVRREAEHKKDPDASEQDRADVARRRAQWLRHRVMSIPAVGVLDETWVRRTWPRCAAGRRAASA